VSVKPSIIADPNAALKQARLLLGSDPEAAIRQARKLLESQPGEPAALRLLGAGLRKQGKVAEAEQAEKAAVEASARSPAHVEAARALVTGDTKRAVAILRTLIEQDGTDVVALVMLGGQLSLEAEYESAESLLHRAMDAAPGDVAARMALAEHLHRAGRITKALSVMDGLGASAQAPAAQSVRANILRDLGRQEEEIAILEQLTTSQPRIESYALRLGHAYRTVGRTDDAIAAYRGVIAKMPFEGSAWWNLANLKTAKFSDQDIAQMERGLTAPNAPLLNRVQLNFALGRVFEDRQDAERSFRHYHAGNQLKKTISPYRSEKLETWIDKAEATYTPEFFAERSTAGFSAPDPIFVVGVQRSGSTLVEQILDSHPQIEGTAELTELPTIVREQGDIAHRRGMTFNEHLQRMSADELRAIGEEYVTRVGVYRRTNKPFFTDKMSTNWTYAGLIRLVLPNARIVDVRRHPLDCCFANWKQLFGKGFEHTYSMEHMGRYYADYVRLMRLMDRVQPGKIHRVIYERLVDDTEGEIRRLLDYLGLPFEKACLNFHSNKRSVRTISTEQVRRPINREGIGRWQPYEQWLGPMKSALGSALETWDK
jgi:tetratricopeptide (TPR) repeat protein